MLEVRQVGKFGKVKRSEKFGGREVWMSRRICGIFSIL
jgi:hypothetical protein